MDRADVPFEFRGEPRSVMYMILYSELAEDSVLSTLDRIGVPGFTQLAKVTGRGPRGHHFDSRAWPGANGMIYCVVGPEQSRSLEPALETLSHTLERQSNGSQGLHVFTWTCQQLF